MTDRYAVVGHPVAHSKSPLIHRLFAEQAGQDLVYETLLAPLDGFAATVRAFFAGGGKGLNVTVPFKAEAFVLADVCSPRARQASAVNTLGCDADGRLWGDNTDGAGLVRDLTANLGLDLAGKRILLLGAGGAARGVVGPLLALAPAALVIANRTRERALELARAFAACGPVRDAGFDAMGSGYDLVVNATSSSTRGEPLALPAGVLAPGATAYDMAYGEAARAFLQGARAAGARACDGLGMLVEQAAESFHLWRGKRPETAEVIAALRAA